VQALTYLATVFPSLTHSTIIGALDKAGGDIRLTANALLEAGYHHP
jgi:hypothetical protein